MTEEQDQIRADYEAAVRAKESALEESETQRGIVARLEAELEQERAKAAAFFNTLVAAERALASTPKPATEKPEDKPDYLYRSKPQLVEAVQWTGENWSEVLAFGGPDAKVATVIPEEGEPTEIQLLAGVDGAQGWLDVPIGHWIMREPGDLSNIWPVEAGYFLGKYVKNDA